MDAIERLTQTLLYEGYILWPYRRSAVKNAQRWTIGGVYPPAFAEQSGGADRSTVRAECLIEACEGAEVEVTGRYLQVVARQMMRAEQDGLAPVDQLVVGQERYLSWDEAVERQCRGSLVLRSYPQLRVFPIDVPPGATSEELPGGAITRTWEPLSGVMTIAAEPIETRDERTLFKVSTDLRNTAQWQGFDRGAAMRRTFVSAHLVLNANAGSFASLVDPPDHLREATRACKSQGLWPVLVGEDGAQYTMLASPIILSDYPRIAPESPGDLFDGGEIDQLLILNILALTDDERDEMRATDPRARAIIERCTMLAPQDLQRLHGVIRAMRPIS